MDERDAFLNFLRSSVGANDNTDNHASCDAPQSQVQSQTSNNWSGNTINTINIEKIELSINLPDSKKTEALYRTIQEMAETKASKKNLTDRAIVQAVRELILSGDTLSKKASYYPQVDSTGPVTDIKKTALARVIQCKEWNTLFHNNEPLSLYAL